MPFKLSSHQEVKATFLNLVCVLLKLLQGEQLKRSNNLDPSDESPSTVFASNKWGLLVFICIACNYWFPESFLIFICFNSALVNGFKKPGLLRNPKYIDTRMDEVFPVKKSRLRILSGKDNAKVSALLLKILLQNVLK